jgi:hypothetical protein
VPAGAGVEDLAGATGVAGVGIAGSDVAGAALARSGPLDP